MSWQLLFFIVLTIGGLWVILWESRPRKLALSPLTTFPPAKPDPDEGIKSLG
jgi:hypothetical protein